MNRNKDSQGLTDKSAKEDLAEERDNIRMTRSGAAESGYHPPTPEDIEDLKKDHRTSTAPGGINADEAVRLNSSSGEAESEEDLPSDEQDVKRTA